MISQVIKLRILTRSSCKIRNIALHETFCTNSACISQRHIHGIPKYELPALTNSKIASCCTNHSTKSYSTLNNVEETHQSEVIDDGKEIRRMFPSPRQTLNVIAAKMPEKVFETYFKILPKDKSRINHDWLCTYSFSWPDKIKFESINKSKHGAATEAAYQALAWLYESKYINSEGIPRIPKTDEVEEVDLMRVTLSEEKLQEIYKLAEVYNENIRQTYKQTHEDAMLRNDQAVTTTFDEIGSDEEDLAAEETASSDSEKEALSEIDSPNTVHPLYGRQFLSTGPEAMDKRRKKLDESLRYFRKNRAPLPIDEYIDTIMSAVSSNRAVIVSGAPGCGKSTRLPAAILEAAGVGARVLVSEPRRLAAVGLAARVADEMAEEVGESVGYQVRLQSKLPRPPGGSVLFCTSGMLLNRLQANPGLEGVSHVILDEAHERDVNTDLALSLLKRALTVNPELRLIVASATLNIDVLQSYFDDCPVIQVPGRLHPVEPVYLEDMAQTLDLDGLDTALVNSEDDSKPILDYDKVADVIAAIDKTEQDGAILVFLPGWAEIKAVKQLLDEKFKDSGRHMILPVHSKLSVADQSVMLGHAPPMVRKIVLATNIAETSVTVPDVTCVVDCGAHRETGLWKGASSLRLTWISQSSAKQRMGRAGRVKPGRCFKLYTREKEAAFAEHVSAEIGRIPLEKTVLDCKTYAPEERAWAFLSRLPEPPSMMAVRRAVAELVELGCLTRGREILTPTGRLVATMTLEPRLGVALLHSLATGTAGGVARVITHMAAGGEVFDNSAERREEIRSIKSSYHPTSDHLALSKMQQQFVSEERSGSSDRFCRKLGLRKERMLNAEALYNLHATQLLKCGVPEPGDWSEVDRNSELDDLVVATVLSGAERLLSSKRQYKSSGKMVRVKEFYTSNGERAQVPTDSVNRQRTKDDPSAQLLLYWDGMYSAERGAVVPRATSLVSHLTALLFCSSADRVVPNANEMACRLLESNENKTSDGVEWITLFLSRQNVRIEIPKSQSYAIIKLRVMLWATFRYVIERDSTTPERDDTVQFRNSLVDTVARIIRSQN